MDLKLKKIDDLFLIYLFCLPYLYLNFKYKYSSNSIDFIDIFISFIIYLDNFIVFLLYFNYFNIEKQIK
jgi:hypothetical protein